MSSSKSVLNFEVKEVVVKIQTRPTEGPRASFFFFFFFFCASENCWDLCPALHDFSMHLIGLKPVWKLSFEFLAIQLRVLTLFFFFFFFFHVTTDPVQNRVVMYPGFRANGFVEICENSLRALLEKPELSEHRLLLYLVPLSIFYKRKAAQMSYELEDKSGDVENLLDVIATLWKAALALCSNEDERQDLKESVQLFKHDMSNYDIDADWGFLDSESEDRAEEKLESSDCTRMIHEAIETHLRKRFSWQKTLPELVGRQSEYAITREMVEAQKSPPRPDIQGDEAAAAAKVRSVTPVKVLKVLRDLR